MELTPQIILISYQIEICPKKSNQSSTDTSDISTIPFFDLYTFSFWLSSPPSIHHSHDTLYSGLQKLSSHSTFPQFFFFFFPRSWAVIFKNLDFHNYFYIFLNNLDILLSMLLPSNQSYQCYFHLIKACDRNILI